MKERRPATRNAHRRIVLAPDAGSPSIIPQEANGSALAASEATFSRLL